MPATWKRWKRLARTSLETSPSNMPVTGGFQVVYHLAHLKQGGSEFKVLFSQSYLIEKLMRVFMFSQLISSQGLWHRKNLLPH